MIGECLDEGDLEEEFHGYALLFDLSVVQNLREILLSQLQNKRPILTNHRIRIRVLLLEKTLTPNITHRLIYLHRFELLLCIIVINIERLELEVVHIFEGVQASRNQHSHRLTGTILS